MESIWGFFSWLKCCLQVGLLHMFLGFFSARNLETANAYSCLFCWIVTLPKKLTKKGTSQSFFFWRWIFSFRILVKKTHPLARSPHAPWMMDLFQLASGSQFPVTNLRFKMSPFNFSVFVLIKCFCIKKYNWFFLWFCVTFPSYKLGSCYTLPRQMGRCPVARQEHAACLSKALAHQVGYSKVGMQKLYGWSTNQPLPLTYPPLRK